MIKAEPSFNIIRPHRELNIVASPGLRLGWEISDAKTGEVERKGSQEGRSFTKQFLQLLYAMMSMENETLKHDNGSNYAMNWDFYGYYAMRYYDMDIGSSAQAVDFGDYNLISPIGNGTGAGQMQYGSITHTAPNYDESRVWNRETRSFTNNSGGDVTINELGHKVYSGAGSSNRYVLIMRDVTGEIVVPNTKVITFNYDMESQKGTGWTFLQEFFTQLYTYLCYTGSDKYYPTLRVLTPPYGNFVNAGTTQYRYNYNILSGIELGTLNSAIEVTQTTVGQLIEHGKGEGQLESYGTFVESPTYDAISGQFDIVKHFKNSSGASIDVYQVGLRCLYYNYPTLANSKLIFCKLLSSPFVIPDGSYAEVRITMKVAV